MDRFVLPDDALVENLVEAEEFVFFPFQKARNGDAGPAGDDIADFLGGDFFANEFGLATFFFGIDSGLGSFQFLFEGRKATVLEFGDLIEVVAALGGFDFLSDLVDLGADFARGLNSTALGLPTGVEGIALRFEVCQLLFQSFEAFFGGSVFLLLESFALDLELECPALEVFEFFGHRLDFGPEFGGGFVDEIDGFVGEETVGDIAMGKGGGGDEGSVLDTYAVVHFVPFTETAKDGDGVLDGGFGYGDGLETAFEGCVFLDIFTILVEGGGADAVQFPSGEHGFEHIASVHGAFGFACTNDGMDFIDKKNDGSLGLDHLVEDGFEALFEFASELGPRNQSGQI